MAPGGLVKDPISAMSLGLALIFGTAGLPHILMRFFTVRDARQARTVGAGRDRVHLRVLHSAVRPRLRRHRPRARPIRSFKDAAGA